ncbi:hypothetical protein ACFYZ8_05585 [Streptomyces sp. NPDC001668]|uniref:hypothetical protein n=1 Tax=unclassified Streptomyces TaxID=2593676 RepID=UPI0033E10BBF
MTQVLISLIAVAGTLLGGCLGYFLQRHAGNRAERRAAVLAYTGAITELIHAQQDWWWRKHEQPDGPEHKAARVEGQRLRRVARQTINGLLFTVGDAELVAEARQILEEANTVHRAADRTEMSARAAAVRTALDTFIHHASARVR